MRYIYVITNKIDSKIYIGQTNNPRHRWNQHRASAKKGSNDCSRLYHAMRKHGEDNFEFKVLCESDSIDEINRLEEKYIDKYQSVVNGYNIALGGLHAKRSQETRDKISKAKSGPNHHFFGKTFSNEHRKNISIANKGKLAGEKNGMFGKTHTDEVKAIISKTHTGVVFSDERREKISKSKQGENNPMFGIPKEEHPRFGAHLSDSQKQHLSELNKGAKHPRCKISDAQVLEIKNKHANGSTKQDLAKQYNCSEGSIYRIVNGGRD